VIYYICTKLPEGISLNSITFLGTGGARIMLSTQVLATGGMIVELEDTAFSLDPGPGALVNSFKYGINPTKLDGIITSHRHLDHSADINVMIEAMTRGGLQKKGHLFAPADALDKDPVVLKYLRGYLNKITYLKPNSEYSIKKLPFKTSMPHNHGVETYGFIFSGKNVTLGYLPDTAYFPELLDFYKADILVVSMLIMDNRPVLHLSVNDVEKIISSVKPKITILTHLGLKIFEHGAEKIAYYLSEKTNQRVIAATDGFRFKF
jgi:ribonuclease BN (tRNA processing enzyme)